MSKKGGKVAANVLNSTADNSTVQNVRHSSKVVWTYILGEGIEINEGGYSNYPEWFWWIIIVGVLVCCVSCIAWVICALFFFKRDKPCTHTLHVVVDKDAGSPKKGSSPKKEDDAKNDQPAPEPEFSFTRPLTPPGGYGRSSKRSSRKEEKPEEKGGHESRKSSKEPDSRKSSKKSASKKSQKSGGGGSKKSQKSGSKKSRKSERADGGRDVLEYCIQMDSDDVVGNQSPNPMKDGWFEKISRSIFFSRDL